MTGDARTECRLGPGAAAVRPPAPELGAVARLARAGRLLLLAAVTGAWLSAVAADSAGLVAVGVLGNSGEAGETLVRVGLTEFANCATGVAVDADLALWTSGGDRLNHYGLDGHLMSSQALLPAGSRVDSRTFALVGGRVLFLARLPNQQPALFAFDPTTPNAAAQALPVALPKRKRDWVPYLLAPQPLDGKLVLLFEPDEPTAPGLRVCWLDPETLALTPAFDLAGEHPGGVAVDAARRVLYIGACFGQFVGGQTHSTMAGITAVQPDGTPLSAHYPVACTKTPAVPTQFRGIVSLAGGALWDTAWYGFLARLDAAAGGAPGRVVQWHHELGYPTQIAALDSAAEQHSGLLTVTTAAPDALYLADWDESLRQLQLRRRIGCLPMVTSLGLSADGWVTVGTGRCQAWWRFEDGADAPPRKAGLHIAITPGVFRGGDYLALAAQYTLADLQRNRPVAAVFSDRPGGNNEARRVTDQVPVKRPVGLSVHDPAGPGVATLWVTDAESGKLWQTPVSRPELKPDNARWKPVAVADPALEPLLQTATAVAAVADDRLLLAVEGSLVLAGVTPAGLQTEWQMSEWGTDAGQRFGKRLRLAADGTRVLVSDTDRHRVILFEWPTRTWLGQHGVTDQPGTDLRHLDCPTCVALSSGRGLVADQGNQRVVKLTQAP